MNTVKDVIENGFHSLAEQLHQGASEIRFTVTVSDEVKFMLEEMAQIIDQPLTTFAGDLLEAAAVESLEHFPLSQLDIAAGNAEIKTLEHRQKTFTKYEYAGDVTRWPYFVQILQKEEAKK